MLTFLGNWVLPPIHPLCSSLPQLCARPPPAYYSHQLRQQDPAALPAATSLLLPLSPFSGASAGIPSTFPSAPPKLPEHPNLAIFVKYPFFSLGSHLCPSCGRARGQTKYPRGDLRLHDLSCVPSRPPASSKMPRPPAEHLPSPSPIPGNQAGTLTGRAAAAPPPISPTSPPLPLPPLLPPPPGILGVVVFGLSRVGGAASRALEPSVPMSVQLLPRLQIH